ncbi:uncharacterized protein LOC101242306 isoform X1 [Ciona intestinalis]
MAMEVSVPKKLRRGLRRTLERSGSLEDTSSQIQDETAQSQNKGTKTFTRWNSARLPRTSRGLSIFSNKSVKIKSEAKSVAGESRVARGRNMLENLWINRKSGAMATGPDCGSEYIHENTSRNGSPQVQRSTKGHKQREKMKENIGEEIAPVQAKKKSRGVAKEFAKTPLGSLSAILTRARNSDVTNSEEHKGDKKRRPQRKFGIKISSKQKVLDAEETDAAMGNKSSKKEQRTKSDVVSTTEPAMEQPFEENPTILKNKAARDRIAARPKNRRAATRRVLASVKESDTASELDIPDSIFAPIENAKKPDLPVEEDNQTTSDIKPEEPEDVDVKARRKSAGPDTLEDAAPKTSSVKKSYSFKSPLGGGGNIKMPSLGDVTKVKLRKTNSNASSSSSVVVVKRTPSFERPQLRSPSKSKDSSENKGSPKVASKGLAHKLSFGKKSKPEGYDKKESKKVEEQKEKKKDLSKSPKQERPNKLNWLGGSKTKNDKNEQKSSVDSDKQAANQGGAPMSPPCDEIAKALERRRKISANKQTEEGDLKMDLTQNKSNEQSPEEEGADRFVKLRKVSKENGAKDTKVSPTENKPVFSPLRQSLKSKEQAGSEKSLKAVDKNPKEKDGEPSPFHVKLRQTKQSGKFLKEKQTDEETKQSSNVIGKTENTMEINPSKNNSVVRKSSLNRNNNNNNNNNSIKILSTEDITSVASTPQEKNVLPHSNKVIDRKSPPKIPTKPKRTLTPNIESAAKPAIPKTRLNSESSKDDKSSKKESPATSSNPDWVSLARKHSKKWEKSNLSSTSNQVKDMEKNENPTEQNPVSQNPKSNQPKNSNADTETEKTTLNPRLKFPSKSLEETGTKPPKPALRSISTHNPSDRKTDTSENLVNKTQSCKLSSTQNIASTGEMPEWQAAVLRRQKRGEEVV